MAIQHGPCRGPRTAANFGWSRRMSHAGYRALVQRYGGGHYATVAAHAGRWRQFIRFCRRRGLRDVREITPETLENYGALLRDLINCRVMATAYAVNLLSSANVTLQALRGDRAVRVSPARLVGRRRTVRDDPPCLSIEAVVAVAEGLRERGHPRAAAAVELARALGLRKRETAMLDAHEALRQAGRYGQVDIRAGTKGGRGREIARWVPVSDWAHEVLRRAAAAQGAGPNLIPCEWRWIDFSRYLQRTAGEALHAAGLGSLHDLRAAYVCARYGALTGYPAPVIAGGRVADRETDLRARETLADELGHGRSDVIGAYYGPVRGG